MPQNFPLDRHLDIGKPISHMKMYVLNSKLVLAGLGVPGELYITGPGLARYYINDAQLTANVFIPNPYSEVLLIIINLIIFVASK